MLTRRDLRSFTVFPIKTLKNGFIVAQANHKNPWIRMRSSDQRRESLYLCLRNIPFGEVRSYGEVAQQAGLGRAARWVGRALKDLPEDTNLPWHRVIRADGKLAFPIGSAPFEEQKRRLIAEGLCVSAHGKVT